MKLGVIIETKEAEKAWNAFRFCNTAQKNGHELKVFLMGEAVECPQVTHPKYPVATQLKTYVDNGGVLLACGTCLTSRQLDGGEVCDISTMVDCVGLVEWADKVVTF